MDYCAIASIIRKTRVKDNSEDALIKECKKEVENFLSL